ncbi:hypothetical protein COY62_01770 [bacterium (Candidatus Howlettbacteria) CG_4_10_14_0_8_um_filter_40_9]|nr:MAG: hypothetical protein COY62_01770 [bacterium (Candidatus Howlettbacteria) CG_4_10_14_0_8_um_filter_40_9]
MTQIHSAEINDKWRKLTLNEQLGNIGSEVGRSISGRSKESAKERALELLDLTISDDRWAGPKRKEIARARESYLEAIDSNDAEDLNALNKYFYHFAVSAR